MPRPEIFLSHSSADKESVKAIALQLQQKAIPTWLDEWNLVPGQTFVDELAKALKDCAGCVMFVGPGDAGPWHHEEFRAALERAVTDPAYVLVPVLLPGAKLSQLPGFLASRSCVEFSRIDDPDAIHRLVCGIRGANPYRGLRVFDVDHSRIQSSEPLPKGKSSVRVEFTPVEPGLGKPADVKVFVDGKETGSGRIGKTVPGRYSVEPFDIGRDTVSPVSKDYKVPFAFQGRIDQVTVELK